jgi:hypothetical protein
MSCFCFGLDVDWKERRLVVIQSLELVWPIRKTSLGRSCDPNLKSECRFCILQYVDLRTWNFGRRSTVA